MIITIISVAIVASSLWISYKDFKKDKSNLKNAYLKNPIDYLFAFLLVISVFTTIGVLYTVGMPNFLTWSWVSLLSSGDAATDNSGSGNLFLQPLLSGILPVIIGFWLVFSLAIPYLAKSEELAFRSLNFTTKSRIIESIKFGFIHMIVGVPVIAAIVLSFVGYVFSIWYIKGYTKACKEGKAIEADDFGITRATSLHAKYNFIIVTFLSLLGLLVAIYK